MNKSAPTLILASSSPYRQAVLAKLGIAFECIAPNVDEQSLPGETPQAMVKRLAEDKALAVAKTQPNSLVIGSDQVAVLGQHILTKPGDHATATQQLRLLSGQVVTFLTGLCLYNCTTKKSQIRCIPFKVHFRDLNDAQIQRYLLAETPYDCAGSFKSEALGIALFKRLEGDDPNTLIGLPLIELITMLQNEGIEIP